MRDDRQLYSDVAYLRDAYDVLDNGVGILRREVENLANTAPAPVPTANLLWNGALFHSVNSWYSSVASTDDTAQEAAHWFSHVGTLFSLELDGTDARTDSNNQTLKTTGHTDYLADYSRWNSALGRAEVTGTRTLDNKLPGVLFDAKTPLACALVYAARRTEFIEFDQSAQMFAGIYDNTAGQRKWLSGGMGFTASVSDIAPVTIERRYRMFYTSDRGISLLSPEITIVNAPADGNYSPAFNIGFRWEHQAGQLQVDIYEYTPFTGVYKLLEQVSGGTSYIHQGSFLKTVSGYPSPTGNEREAVYYTKAGEAAALPVFDGTQSSFAAKEFPISVPDDYDRVMTTDRQYFRFGLTKAANLFITNVGTNGGTTVTAPASVFELEYAALYVGLTVQIYDEYDALLATRTVSSRSSNTQLILNSAVAAGSNRKIRIIGAGFHGVLVDRVHLGFRAGGTYEPNYNDVRPLENATEPPPASLSLSAQTFSRQDGTLAVSIVGDVVFGNFALGQIGRVFWKAPDADFIELPGYVEPDDDGNGQFRKFDLVVGVHTFKVLVESETGTPQSAAAEEDTINVSATDYSINNTVIRDGVLRAYAGFDPDGKYTGRDTAVVPTSVINAKVSLSTVKDAGFNVDFELQGVITNRSLQTSQADSIDEAEVTVYDKFGNLAKNPQGGDAIFSAGYNGAGTLASGDLKRIYTDPRYEAIFKIRVKNSKGWSGYIYLQPGGIVTTSMPAVLLLAATPSNLQTSPQSSSTIRLNFTASYNCHVYRRYLDENDFTLILTGQAGGVADVTGLPADTEVEFYVANSSNLNNKSNIRRTRTLQIGQIAPARPAPSALAVVADPSDPDNNLKATWIRNATDNTSVDFEVNGSIGSLSAADVEEYINAIGQVASRTVRVRNVWTSGVLTSDWAGPITGTTEATPVSAPPGNFAAIFDDTNNVIYSSWTAGGGTNLYTLEESSTGANLQAASGTNGWTTISNGITGLSNSYAFAQTSVEQTRYLRIKHNSAGVWVSSGAIIIPVQETGGNQPPTPGTCFFSGGLHRFQFSWTPNGGAGQFIIEGINLFNGETWGSGSIYSLASASSTTKNIFYNPGYVEEWQFRISRADVTTGGIDNDGWAYWDPIDTY